MGSPAPADPDGCLLLRLESADVQRWPEVWFGGFCKGGSLVGIWLWVG